MSTLFDLVGYGSAVVLLVSILLLAPYVLFRVLWPVAVIVLVSGVEDKDLRIKLHSWLFDKVKTRFDPESTGFNVGDVGLVSGVIGSFWWVAILTTESETQTSTFSIAIEHIDSAATAVAPFLGFCTSTIAIIAVLQYVIAKSATKVYELQQKLDKL